MTFKMINTTLAGFPIQYSKELIQPLNEIFDSKQINNFDLELIGNSVSGYIEHFSHSPITGDDYHWFGSLAYNVEGKKLILLFPWAEDFENPESKMDRSINVYSNEEISGEDVKNFLEKMVLSFKE